jgi:hypothetical protein
MPSSSQSVATSSTIERIVVRLIEVLFGRLVIVLLSLHAQTAPQDLERQLKRLQLITIGVLVGGTALLSLIDSWLPTHNAQGADNAVALTLANIGFVVMLLLWAGCVGVLLVTDSMRKRIKKAAKGAK